MEDKNIILVDFDMIVNTDIGMFNLVKNFFSSSDCFDKNVLSNSDESSIRYRSINEKYDNILDLFKSEGFKNYNTQNLYNQLYELHIDYILKNSTLTNLLNLLNAYIISDTISVTILCKNIQEQQIINKLNSKFKTILFEEKIDIKEYDSIFMKRYEDILKFGIVECKNIFIANISNNMEKPNVPLLKLSSVIARVNNIYTIDLYSNIENPLG